MKFTFDAQVELDASRGVLLVHSHLTGTTIIRVSGLPKDSPAPRKKPLDVVLPGHCEADLQVLQPPTSGMPEARRQLRIRRRMPGSKM